MNEETTDEWTSSEESHHLPVIRIDGEALVLEHGAVLPQECCVKCGRPAKKTIRKQLRNPTNPLTWFGKREQMELGLCRKHHENRMIALALTWSCLVIGVAVLVGGAINLDPVLTGIGAIFAGVSGVFRACYPCRLKESDEEKLVIGGVGEGCRSVLLTAGAVEEAEPAGEAA